MHNSIHSLILFIHCDCQLYVSSCLTIIICNEYFAATFYRHNLLFILFLFHYFTPDDYGCIFYFCGKQHVCFIDISTSFIIIWHANFYGRSWFYAHSASSTYKKLIFHMNHPSLERIFRKHILHKKKAPAWLATADPENIYRGELCLFPRTTTRSPRESLPLSRTSLLHQCMTS